MAPTPEQDLAAAPGGLTRLVVRGLFGARRYDIELEPARPTVLTGANGSGKSTLLRLVNAVATHDVRALATAPVELFALHFQKLSTFTLRRAMDGEVQVQWGEAEGAIRPVQPIGDLPDWAVDVLKVTDFTDIDELEDPLMEAAQVADLSYADFRRLWLDIKRQGIESFLYEAPPWLSDLADALTVFFITDQRLVVEDDRREPARPTQRSLPSKLAVEVAGGKIAARMRQVDSAYARVSQEQDRQFPQNVIRAMREQSVIPLDELEELVASVEEQRGKLRAVGLLDTTQVFGPDTEEESLADSTVRPVIAAFLESTLEKMEVLDDLADRLGAFKNFLDSRYVGKSVVLDRRRGVTLRLADGAEIRPRQLSSGEQQMFVLAYEILFRAQPGTVLMIDEPEISLHVLWQDTLVDNLISMGRAAGLQFLLATHSPVLLASHPELERSLDEPA